MATHNINIAMPIAHRPKATGTYQDFYQVSGSETQNVFKILDYFSKNGCEGLHLGKNAAFTSPQSSLWNLYAVTDGFLSFQNESLILRLPGLLTKTKVQKFNSGKNLLRMSIRGGHTGTQLRHVVYRYSHTPLSSKFLEQHVKAHLKTILENNQHPGRSITFVKDSSGADSSLEKFLKTDQTSKIETLLQSFMNGEIELFVQAGDLIGDFESGTIEIQYRDSCGNLGLSNKTKDTKPRSPTGRAISPSFFLYQFVKFDSKVNLITAFEQNPADANTRHPILDLLSGTAVPEDLRLAFNQNHPPKPLLFTELVPNNSPTLETKSIKIGTLGEFHESLNHSNPFETLAAVRWRYYGAQTGEAESEKYCKFLTEIKSGFDGDKFLPGKDAFHQHTPAKIYRTLVRRLWTRYGPAFNAVATAFEVPCELLVTIACKETAYTKYCKSDFDQSGEADITRLEPLKSFKFPDGTAVHADDDKAFEAIAKKLATQHSVTEAMAKKYLQTAGVQSCKYPKVKDAAGNEKDVTKKIGRNGSRGFLPIPWNDNAAIGSSGLTWGELATLVGAAPGVFRISPGVAQTLISSGITFAIKWSDAVYGSDYIEGISAEFTSGTGNTSRTVTLQVPKPNSNDPKDLLVNWYGICVDQNGKAQSDYTPQDGPFVADVRLTKQQRALHCLITTALQIKRRYNTVQGKKKYNFVTDFDLITVASGYNDGANSKKLPKAIQARQNKLIAANKSERLKLIYALNFNDGKYPDFSAKYFNAIVEYFNGHPNDPAIYTTPTNEDPMPSSPGPSLPPSLRFCP